MEQHHSIGVLLLVQLILILLNAIFAAAEIAIISVNDTKLENMAAKGNKKAARLVKLTSKPAKFLATIQVAITLSGFLGSAFAADNFSDIIVNWLIGLGVTIPRSTLNTISVVVITLILSYFTLIFGELVPKRVAMRKAESVALGISGLIGAVSTIFAPIVWLLTASTNGILRLLRIDPNAEDEECGEEEIRMMVDASSEKGKIDRQEQQLIQNVFEFDDLTAGEIAVHRTDVDILWLEDSDADWEASIRQGVHTLYPVCDDTVDNVVGVLNAKQYFRMDSHKREDVMAQAVKPPYFVPENVKADLLFEKMKQTHNFFAVVLDEYGGVAGIITMNDLIEQLVGDFEPEAQEEAQRPEIEKISSGDADVWSISGSAGLHEVETALEVTLDDEGCDTFGGYVFGILGEIPEDGSQQELRIGRLLIKLDEIDEHQIVRATVTKLSKPESPDNDSGK